MSETPRQAFEALLQVAVVDEMERAGCAQSTIDGTRRRWLARFDAAQNGQWIKMAERAPEHAQEVIYYTRSHTDDWGHDCNPEVRTGVYHHESDVRHEVVGKKMVRNRWGVGVGALLMVEEDVWADVLHEDRYFDDGGEGLAPVEAEYVTHWMPLPEPPK